MTTTIDLTPFRTAETLLWKQLTVFEPHRGNDGTLIADGVHSLPLDTWLPSECRTGHYMSPEGVGIAVVDPETLDDVREAVRAWCREQLSRDGIEFED